MFLEISTFLKEIFQFSRKISSKTLTPAQIWILIKVSSIIFFYCACLMLFTLIKSQIWVGKDFLLEILRENWKIIFENILLSKKIDFTSMCFSEACRFVFRFLYWDNKKLSFHTSQGQLCDFFSMIHKYLFCSKSYVKSIEFKIFNFHWCYLNVFFRDV